ncbi:glycoside hydrolase family 3 protein [Jiangella asiatica]|uniref:beta-N-acetylhexosaminidase n=1 Tax=Jiangella asiatica TaxID=2530372 RepID=A0A4R5CU33_9ACTN|nr:glycoside hydrolase family 3 N-terminal domain-containing protein [Jiangella asiatica]TDE02431.1 beta-N-acetylhexosaminidase [Jiangella asiatica]
MRRLLLLLVGALVLAACSDDGSGPATQPTEPTASPPTTSPSETPSPTPTPPPLAWGPTQAEYDEAARIVSDLSVERQAGQVIVARYAGLEPPVDLIAELGLGGVILMGDNVESPEQVSRASAAIQEAGAGDYPVIVGIDQEGGSVARIREPATEFPAYMTLGASRDTAMATDAARASGEELRAMGLTMVFAPDADVTTGPDDPTIGSRSASSDPALVADIVSASLAGYAESGIVAVAKHFPGHGSVPADSHEELPVQSAGLDELRARDFVPFQAAVAAGAEAVMVAHIDVEAVDPGVPSSLSPAVIGLLRDELGFDGVVVTDAQDMAAISDGYGSGAAAVRSLAAGADIVLMPADPRAAHQAIVDAVASGELPAQRLAEAAIRGIALMLHQAAAGAPPDPGVVGSNGGLSYEESLAGVTVVAGACEGPLVGDTVQVVGGTDLDRARFTEAAQAAGLTVGSSGEVVRLLGGTDSGAGDVVVALDTPYALGASDARVRIALYGRTPGAFRALVDVLRGAAPAAGMLPVLVDGVEQQGCPG